MYKIETKKEKNLQLFKPFFNFLIFFFFFTNVKLYVSFQVIEMLDWCREYVTHTRLRVNIQDLQLPDFLLHILVQRDQPPRYLDLLNKIKQYSKVISFYIRFDMSYIDPFV